MRNKFYSLTSNAARRWFLGETLSKINMGILAKQGMRGFKKVVYIRIVSGSTPGDFLEVGFPLLVVSAKVVKIWKPFEKFETYPVVIEDKVSPVKYVGVTFLGRGGPFDPEKSKAVYAYDKKGNRAIMNMDGLYFDDSHWDGSDLFTIDDFPCIPIVTEQVVKAMKKACVTNCIYTPLEKYRIY